MFLHPLARWGYCSTLVLNRTGSRPQGPGCSTAEPAVAADVVVAVVADTSICWLAQHLMPNSLKLQGM